MELGYEPEDGQPEDRPDEAYDNPQAEPAVETATKSHLTDGQSSTKEDS